MGEWVDGCGDKVGLLSFARRVLFFAAVSFRALNIDDFLYFKAHFLAPRDL